MRLFFTDQLPLPPDCIRLVLNVKGPLERDREVHADLYLKGRLIECDDFFDFKAPDREPGEQSYWVDTVYVKRKLEEIAFKRYGVKPKLVIIRTNNHRPYEVW